MAIEEKFAAVITARDLTAGPLRQIGLRFGASGAQYGLGSDRRGGGECRAAVRHPRRAGWVGRRADGGACRNWRGGRVLWPLRAARRR
jgi:hypothetical protein